MRARPITAASFLSFVSRMLLVNSNAATAADPKTSCFQDTCLNPHEPLGEAFGMEQFVDTNYALPILEIIHRTQTYIFETVLRHLDDHLPKDCWNHNPYCAFLAVMGRCDDEWMHRYCAPSCQACPDIYTDRCHAFVEASRDVLNPGDLNRLFANIAESYPKNVTAVSQPRSGDDDKPWIITLDEFLTDDECEAIIALAGDFVGSQEQFVTPTGEQTNLDRFHCTHPDCDYSLLFIKIRQKLHQLTGFPINTMDFAQILRYQRNQQLALHHDWVDEDIKFPQGPRVLTVNLYLNDVEQGGGTEFPELGAIVQPKRGRIAIWPNALSSNLEMQDLRTEHRSIPVAKGEKYGVSVCLYLRDYRNPYQHGCAYKSSLSSNPS